MTKPEKITGTKTDAALEANRIQVEFEKGPASQAAVQLVEELIVAVARQRISNLGRDVTDEALIREIKTIGDEISGPDKEETSQFASDLARVVQAEPALLEPFFEFARLIGADIPSPTKASESSHE